MPNIKLALRTLFKSPFVTVVAALSLALGIGANAAIFSLFNEMLMRPLPVPEPTRLVNLEAPGPKPGSQTCSSAGSCEVVFSYPMYRDLERAQTVFTGLAAHRQFGANLAFRGQTMNTTGMQVSGSYFPTLGLRPALGRLFTPEDDRTIGAHFVTVLSYDFWERTMGLDPTVIGQNITINGHPMTIIGVAPQGFAGTTLGEKPRIYVPLTMRGVMSPGFRNFENRRAYWVYVFARLKPGVTIDRARTAINTAYRPIIQGTEAALQQGMSPETLERFRKKSVLVVDGRRGQSTVQTEARVPLILMFSVTGIVLLIACANIANLLLSRAASRAMEMAVRLSLGATRRQLIGQLLTEACLLALIGGAASLVVARWTLGAIAGMLPPEAADTLTFTIEPAVVVFTSALALLTGIAFGLFPALHSTRPELITALRSGAGNLSGTKGASRFRSTLVTAQIALSTALLISAGLFIKSLNNVTRLDLGVKIDNISTFSISPTLSGYDSLRARALYARLEEELKSIPGVNSVAASLVPVLAGSSWGNTVGVQGFAKGPDTDANARFNAISPGYFQTLGIDRLAGRDFTNADMRGAPRVAIVNEAFARKFGLMGSGAGGAGPLNVIGKRMDMGNDSLDIEIVGLVRNARYSDVKDSVPPLFFIPYRQDSRANSMYFYLRSSIDPKQILPQIPGLLRKVDPMLPVEELKSLPQQVRENIFMDRMISIMSASFAFLATLLAAIGLYGVLAYSVAQRTNEIGIRVALGANATRVRLMVLRQVAVMTLIGGLLGVAGALAAGRGAASMLFEIKGYDPVVFILSTILLMLVSLAAGIIPAMRASRVDPIRALRYE
ncbi:MAG TPA: ABC transporter permease [Gemmatimonadaceae bacterium]|nr:ABC transporter permease [Gemmatimonadaceae bacterium]